MNIISPRIGGIGPVLSSLLSLNGSGGVGCSQYYGINVNRSLMEGVGT